MNADQIAVIAIPIGTDWNVEFHLGIGVVGLRLAEIPRHPGATEIRAREAPIHGLFRRDAANVDGALLEDAVLC